MSAAPTVRAIETHYKGYRFRSRLEARWAVFFDAMGLEWEYEPQGFVLGNTAYLPDFYLPELGAFIEIKGQMPSGEEYQKAQMLSAVRPTYIFKGDPMGAFAWRFEDGVRPLGPTNCRFVWHRFPGEFDHIAIECDDRNDWELSNLYLLGTAGRCAQKARAARFEHGERP